MGTRHGNTLPSFSMPFKRYIDNGKWISVIVWIMIFWFYLLRIVGLLTNVLTGTGLRWNWHHENMAELFVDISSYIAMSLSRTFIDNTIFSQELLFRNEVMFYCLVLWNDWMKCKGFYVLADDVRYKVDKKSYAQWYCSLIHLK